MIVTHLSLTDFRNYVSLEVELHPGANLFVGSNGQGKTNLVEALGYLSTLGSHRVPLDHAMIRQGTGSAIVRAQLTHSGGGAHVKRDVLAEVQINRSGANRAQVNKSAIRARDLPRYFSSVLFAPEDLVLVRGDPSGRRRFLDDLLVLRTPRMAAVIADYERVLRQRNTLLKSVRTPGTRAGQLDTLDIWDERLIGFGTEIMIARAALVTELYPEVDAAYESIAGADHRPKLAMTLSAMATEASRERPALEPETHTGPLDPSEVIDAFRAALTRLRRSEMERGMTLVGPHRDDLLLELNGLPARGYASHGESWSVALALKLASAVVLRRESSTGDPVLILDDVFAELDESRRNRLAMAIDDYEQILITAAVRGDVPDSLAGNVVMIRGGQVVTG